jgi:hypothetical protein
LEKVQDTGQGTPWVSGRVIAESGPRRGVCCFCQARHRVGATGWRCGCPPGWRKVLEIVRYQIFGTRGLRTFEKHVVVRVRAYVQARGWTDPETLFANRAKGAGYDFFRSFEPRAADDLFIFRIDIGANAVPWPSTMLGGSRFSKASQRQLQNVRLCATWEHRPGSNR